MIGVIVVSIAAIACVLFNITSITFVKDQVRRQQMAQDIDGLLQTTVSLINNTFAQYGGAQQFLREKCAVNPGEVFFANPVVSPACLDADFHANFGIQKSGPANEVRARLGMIQWPVDSYVMRFEITPFKAGTQPNDFVAVTAPTPLYDISHLRVEMTITSPSPNNPAEPFTVRQFAFTISI